MYIVISICLMLEMPDMLQTRIQTVSFEVHLRGHLQCILYVQRSLLRVYVLIVGVFVLTWCNLHEILDLFLSPKRQLKML